MPADRLQTAYHQRRDSCFIPPITMQIFVGPESACTFGSVQKDHTRGSLGSRFHWFMWVPLSSVRVVHACPVGGTNCLGSWGHSGG